MMFYSQKKSKKDRRIKDDELEEIVRFLEKNPGIIKKHEETQKKLRKMGAWGL